MSALRKTPSPRASKGQSARIQTISEPWHNGNCMEYWTRCRAGPAQPEVEKEKKKEAQSCKLQAASSKLDKY